ncbi:MAG: alpha/beta fold hydrolase [Actinomycetota bacterium]|jgi:3-oxoadipate enol-lactonase|nr:alpha/beta fold hydrolase [Actinomycetota bacterium]
MTRVVIERDGLEVVSEIEGPDGAPVVTLAHAQTLDRSSWDSLARSLTDRYRVLRVDLRGHGESAEPVADFTIEDLAADVVATLDAVDVGATHFAGSSLGGMVGYALAIDHPARLASVTFIATQGILPEESHATLRANAEALRASGEPMSSLATKILARYMNLTFAGIDPEGYRRLADQIAGTSVEGYIRSSIAIMGMNFDDRLDRINSSTMVIAGELDRPTPPERMRLYLDHIAGAQMAVIPGAGHFPFADQPDEFNRTLRGFLDSLDS